MNKEFHEDIVTVADHLLDAVFVVSDKGRINYVSAACKEIFGYTPTEMVGKSVIELVVPEDREKTRIEAGEVMAGQKRVGFENRYRHKDGRDVHVMWSARWVESKNLRIGVARDVTALRQKKILSHGFSPFLEPLTPREREVFELLLTEAAEKQIAARLGLAVSTTHAYITTIFRKYGVRGRAGLMSLWISQFARS